MPNLPRPSGAGGRYWRRWPGTGPGRAVPGGLIMLKLVMIDVAVCAALITVAFCAMLLRWRRRRKRGLLRRTRRGTTAGPAGRRAALPETPLVPWFTADRT